jgi:hypothetical protein
MSQSVEERMPLVEDILGEHESDLGPDYLGYKNHVYRMINFCFAQSDFNDEEREKIIIAGCFHDIGIWTAGTFDYIPPSIEIAREYLQSRALDTWTPQIVTMIGEHHKLRQYKPDRLTEIFRRGDLVDFSLGFLKCGISRSRVSEVRSRFPNAGFHRGLLSQAARWFIKHPLDPVPVLKW